MRMLDCVVIYFGLDEEERPTYRRFFCYHIVAGPGPTAGAGVASITKLEIYADIERCTSRQNFHAVDTGGPTAAMARALRYLDAYHEKGRLQRVQSEIRSLGSDLSARPAPPLLPQPGREPSRTPLGGPA